MPAASPEVSRLVEAINDVFGAFRPEDVVPDVQGFLEHFPEVFDAIGSNWKKFASQVQDDLPINGEVSDAMFDMVPSVTGLSDAAKEVHKTFLRVHEQEIEQHENPRTNEKAWNAK